MGHTRTRIMLRVKIFSDRSSYEQPQQRLSLDTPWAMKGWVSLWLLLPRLRGMHPFFLRRCFLVVGPEVGVTRPVTSMLLCRRWWLHVSGRTCRFL